jgi:hypothetical protein
VEWLRCAVTLHFTRFDSGLRTMWLKKKKKTEEDYDREEPTYRWSRAVDYDRQTGRDSSRPWIAVIRCRSSFSRPDLLISDRGFFATPEEANDWLDNWGVEFAKWCDYIESFRKLETFEVSD